MSVILAQNINFSIEGNIILDDVSFEIKKGEYVGLIGPNGAGKTSLVKIILGLYKPTSGNLKKQKNLKIGYVSQVYNLSAIVPVSVREILEMSGISAKKSLIQYLKKVDLNADFLDKNFHTLSGGQKQRVIIARALCLDPEMIIFDEPLSGVDFETKIKLYEFLANLNKNENLTILFISHEVNQIINQCHHVLCLNKTMHTGCHPLDFSKGHICPMDKNPNMTPIHHHHINRKTKCSC